MDNVKGADTQMKRRTVVKGAAWAAPVVTMGMAAPAQAVSPPPVIPTLDASGSCKHSNKKKDNQGYHIAVEWENTLGCDSTVSIISIDVVPTSGTGVSFVGIAPFDVLEGQTVTQSYDSCPTDNMANGTATVVYTYTDCALNTVDAEFPLVISGLNPCQSMGLDHDLSPTRCV